MQLPKSVLVLIYVAYPLLGHALQLFLIQVLIPVLSLTINNLNAVLEL